MVQVRLQGRHTAQVLRTVVQLRGGGGQDHRPEVLLLRQDRLQQDAPTLMAKAPAMQELGTGVEAQYLIELNRHVATLSVAAIRPCPPLTKPPPAELGEEEEEGPGAVQK